MVRPNYLPIIHSLAGRDGELIVIRITVEPRALEQLLESLAETGFHLNPQLLPNTPQGARVEFAAYESWIGPIREGLKRNGLEPVEFEATRMITKLAS